MRRVLSAERTAVEFLFCVPYDHAEALDVDRFSIPVPAFPVTRLFADDALWHTTLLRGS